MKQHTMKMLALLIAVISLLSLAACAEVPNGTATGEEGAVSLWDNASYREDVAFGDGAKEILVEVKAEEKSITFTLHTDKDTLADALLEHKLVEGENGQYGLYIKKVNGITADFDADGYYWSVSRDGAALMTGASETEISGGEHFELTRTKG